MGYAPKCKVDFRDNISSKQLIFLRYNGKQCSLANLKEIFQIGGVGRNLTPRPYMGLS